MLSSAETQLTASERAQLVEKMANVCVRIHMSLVEASAKFFNEQKRHYYVTPSLYIDLLHTFAKIFEAKKSEHYANLFRLKNGLKKLSDANDLVVSMTDELTRLGPQIDVKAREADELIAKLERDTEAVNEVKAIVAKEEEKMRQETEMVRKYALEAEKDLAAVNPLLDAARKSLNSLDKADISEIRVYNNPPFLVMTVMSAVCTILGIKPDWNTAKKMLNDPSFVTRLVTFNAESVSPKIYNKCKQYSKIPDFKPSIVVKVSKACETLCAWVLAVEKYHETYRTVQPKERKLAEANQALDVMRKGLHKKVFLLEQIEKNLDEFKQKYAECAAERSALERRKELMKARMIRATELTTALDTEKVRWSEQYEQLKKVI